MGQPNGASGMEQVLARRLLVVLRERKLFQPHHKLRQRRLLLPDGRRGEDRAGIIRRQQSVSGQARRGGGEISGADHAAGHHHDRQDRGIYAQHQRRRMAEHHRDDGRRRRRQHTHARLRVGGVADRGELPQNRRKTHNVGLVPERGIVYRHTLSRRGDTGKAVPHRRGAGYELHRPRQRRNAVARTGHEARLLLGSAYRRGCRCG